MYDITSFGIAHVSINEVASYRLERTLMRCSISHHGVGEGRGEDESAPGSTSFRRVFKHMVCVAVPYSTPLSSHKPPVLCSNPIAIVSKFAPSPILPAAYLLHVPVRRSAK